MTVIVPPSAQPRRAFHRAMLKPPPAPASCQGRFHFVEPRPFAWQGRCAAGYRGFDRTPIKPRWAGPETQERDLTMTPTSITHFPWTADFVVSLLAVPAYLLLAYRAFTALKDYDQAWRWAIAFALAAVAYDCATQVIAGAL